MLTFSILHGKNKKVLFFLIPFITLALVASFAIPVWAEEPQEKPQLAPVNPEFEAYRQNPPEEFYGYIPPPVDLSHLRDIPIERGHFKDVPTEESFDWRDTNKVSAVKNQNPCGTCWVFGTTSALESAVLMGDESAYDFSEQSVALCVDRSWVYMYDGATDPCNAGGNSFKASEVFIKKGAVQESCNSYDTDTLNCDGSCTCDSCPPVKIVTGYRLVTDEQSQTDLIKEAVYDHGPVTMAFYYSDSHKYTDATYGTVYDYYPCTGGANHLVSIIGWDDAVPHPSPSHSGTGAWLVKNSWGTGWGNSGYFWLAYDSSCMCEIAYLEYKDYDPNVALLYWDEAGWESAAGYTGSDYAWMANAFTAGQAGSLTHVDFWTTSNNAQYEIYVYNDGDPSDGLTNELASKSGTCAEAGYYSIELTSPVSLTASQDFTIAVKMTTPGYNYPIPIEKNLSGTCEPAIQTDVSYISSTGSTWTDLADYSWNACLRARIYSSPTYVTTINIVGKGADTAVSTITFPIGAPGATVSNPFNDVNGPTDKQVVAGTGSEPVVRLNNTSGGTLTVWLSITDWGNDVVASEDYELVAAGTNVSAVTQELSADGNASSVDTGVSILSEGYLDLYLEVELCGTAGVTGTSTLTILGEST